MESTLKVNKATVPENINNEKSSDISVIVVNSRKKLFLSNPLSFIHQRRKEKEQLTSVRKQIDDHKMPVDNSNTFIQDQNSQADSDQGSTDPIPTIIVGKNKRTFLTHPLALINEKRKKLTEKYLNASNEKKHRQQIAGDTGYYLGMLDIFSQGADEYTEFQTKKGSSWNEDVQHEIKERARLRLEDIYFANPGQAAITRQYFDKEGEALEQILDRSQSKIDILKEQTIERGGTFTDEEIKKVEKQAIEKFEKLDDLQRERLLTYVGLSSEQNETVRKRITKSSWLTLAVEGPKEPIGIAGGILFTALLGRHIPDVSPLVSTVLGNVFYYLPLIPMMVQNIRLIEKTGVAPNVFAVTANELTKGSKNKKRSAMVIAHVGFEGVKDFATNAIPFLPVPEAPQFFLSATAIIGMLQLVQAVGTERILRKEKKNYGSNKFGGKI